MKATISDIPALPVAANAAALSEWFRRFSTQAAGSPLYRFLAEAIAEDTALLSIAAKAPDTQPVPNLFLAAVHVLLLEGAAHEVTNFYPSLGGRLRLNASLMSAFKDFVLARAEELTTLLRTRLVQTNEVRRCGALALGFNEIARTGGQAPLHLVELGCAAGLNLNLTRYLYDFGSRGTWGPDTAEVRIPCELRGRIEDAPTGSSPQVSSRVGIDLNPIDLRDPKERLWLDALIWPDQEERRARLRAAIAVALRDPVDPRRGSALDGGLLGDVIASLPVEGEVCVFHSFMANQLTEKQRGELVATIETLSWDRPLWRLSMEWLSTPAPALEFARVAEGRTAVTRRLALCHDHGEWIDWGG